LQIITKEIGGKIMKLNNFVKFPLVLGIVGAICAGALGVVYEITNPIIQAAINAKANAAIMELVPEMEKAEDLTKTVDSALLSKYKVSSVKEVYVAGEKHSYAYQVAGSGRNGDIVMMVILSAKEDKILKLKVLSHSETTGYGDVLFAKDEFNEYFINLDFGDLTKGTDASAGASLSFGGALNGVDNVISFHKQAIKGEESDGINLSDSQRAKFNLADGQVMVDKTEDFKAKLKAASSENKYNSILEGLRLVNFIEIQDATGNVVNYAYVVDQEYSCELEHGSRGKQKYTIALMFDSNWENSKLLIIDSTDSMSSVGFDSLANNAWVNNFNGHTAAELSSMMVGAEIDKISGATFTSNTVIAHVTSIMSAHDRANSK
jgi:RnfABCDGE-type electron transport complex G subunit